MVAKGRPYVRYEPGQKNRLGNKRTRIAHTVRWESGVKRLHNPRSGNSKFQIFRNQQHVTMMDAERYYNQFHEIPPELVEAYREVLQPGLMFALRMDARLSSASLQCPKGEIQTIEPAWEYGLDHFAKKGAVLVYVGVRVATRKGKDSNNVEQLIKTDVHAFLLNGRLVVPRTISMVIPATGDE